LGAVRSGGRIDVMRDGFLSKLAEQLHMDMERQVSVLEKLITEVKGVPDSSGLPAQKGVTLTPGKIGLLQGSALLSVPVPRTPTSACYDCSLFKGDDSNDLV
jgi:hypothetical protein